MSSQPDYLTDDEARELLPDYGGVTVRRDGEPYHLQADGRWWRESVRDAHFAEAEAQGLDPSVYLGERP